MAIHIPENKIEEIKNAADIVEVVSEAVVLKQSGKNYLGLCPFHSEKTPSFTVSREKQIFYCFGCGAGGNVFAFLMKHEGLSFPEAARSLAGRYGVALPAARLSQAQQRQASERERLLAVNRVAQQFFQQALRHAGIGQKARAYLERRGTAQAIVDDFGLGFAPAGWDKLVGYLRRKGVQMEQAETAGLIARRRSRPGHYDRFRERIIFPIRDSAGRVIAFGGRVFGDGQPKYLNSPETPLFNKRKCLYGIDQARGPARNSAQVIVAEGYFDVLTLHQHGRRNCVATLGTALTPDHVRLLRGIVGKDGRVLLVFDSDEAGMKAALRSISVFDKGYVSAHILTLPSGYDPDQYVCEHGAEAFDALAAAAPAIIPFLIESAVTRHGLSVEGRLRIVEELKAVLAGLDDEVAQGLYIKTLAERVGIDEAAVRRKISEAHRRPGGVAVRPRSRAQAERADRVPRGAGAATEVSADPAALRIERQIVAMMLQFPEIRPEAAELNVMDYFEVESLRAIGQAILKYRDVSGERIAALLTRNGDEKHGSMIASFEMDDEPWSLKGGRQLINQFIESRRNRRNRSYLNEQIKDAEMRGDLERLEALMQEKKRQAVLNEKRKMALLEGDE